MANTLVVDAPWPGVSAYAIVQRNSDGKWWNSTAAAWQTPDTAARTQYAITLSGSGVQLTGTMPAVAAGYYTHRVFAGAAGSAATTDPGIGCEALPYWNGTDFVDDLAATNTTDLPTMIETSGGHKRYKATALEQAPSGGGGGGDTIIAGPLTAKITNSGRLTARILRDDSMPSTEQEYITGTDWNFIVQILDDKDASFDLSAATSVKYALVKVGGTTAVITAKDAASNATGAAWGRSTVACPYTPADNASVTPGKYYLQIEWVLSGITGGKNTEPFTVVKGVIA